MKRIRRDLDGYFFRVKVGDNYENICFSDLTEEQMDTVLQNRSTEWLIALCKGLGKTLYSLGEHFDIICTPLSTEGSDSASANN